PGGPPCCTSTVRQLSARVPCSPAIAGRGFRRSLPAKQTLVPCRRGFCSVIENHGEPHTRLGQVPLDNGCSGILVCLADSQMHLQQPLTDVIVVGARVHGNGRFHRN